MKKVFAIDTGDLFFLTGYTLGIVLTFRSSSDILKSVGFNSKFLCFTLYNCSLLSLAPKLVQ